MKTVFAPFLAWGITAAALADDPKTLGWNDLLPANEEEFLDDLYRQQEEAMGALDHGSSANPVGRQLKSFNVVSDLDGETVRLPGFVVPLEFTPSGELSDFLFVPYMGACIHYPPPPPNQIVYATVDNPTYFGDMWNPIWLIGKMRTQQFLNDMGDAAYTLEIEDWAPYTGPES